jgi:hypothetical protein
VENIATLTTAEQEMIKGTIAVVKEILEKNADFMAQVHNFSKQNV